MIYLYLAGFLLLWVGLTVPLVIWFIRYLDRRDRSRRKPEGNVTV